MMKLRLERLFEKQRLSTQVIVVNTLLILVMTLITAAIIRYCTEAYDRVLSDQLTGTLKTATVTLDDELQAVDDMAVSIITDDSIQTQLGVMDDGKLEYADYQVRNSINKVLSNAVASVTIVDYIALLDTHFEPITTVNVKWNEALKQTVSDNLTSDNNNAVWVRTEDETRNVIMVRALNNVKSPELNRLGVLVIGVDVAGSVEYNTERIQTFPVNSLIVSESMKNNVVYSDFEDAEKVSDAMENILNSDKAFETEELAGEKYYAAYRALDLLDWKYAVYVSHSSVYSDINRMKTIQVIVFVLGIALTAVLGFFLTKRMIKPLGRLSEQMKKVEQGEFEPIEMPDDSQSSRNEVASLTEDFNVMVKKIDSLINDNYLKKLLLRENELKMLQLQINPHFLYNTLDSINWMAQMGQGDTVSRMVQSLSTLMRNATKNSEMLIPLKDELELLGHYKYIQSMRFDDRLSVNVDIDPEYFDYPILKLSFQPIVENSIKYSIERYKKTCVVDIRAKKQGDRLLITIADNGTGIEPERLEKIQRGEKLEGKSGVALANIRKRMELAYHDKNVMSIDSEYGKGTTVTLSIPEKMKDNRELTDKWNESLG